MKQFNLTTVMGKRLIGKGMAQHPDIQRVLQKGTLLIIAGTTNGYVAEEILTALGQAEGFSRVGFRRGVTVAQGAKLPKVELAGDVIIVDDEPLVCDFVAKAVSLLGMKVKKNTQALEVIDEVKGHFYNVILLDIFSRRSFAVRMTHLQGGE